MFKWLGEMLHDGRGKFAALAVLLIIVAAALAIYVIGFSGRSGGGATLGDYDGMSREEIQAELDRQVAESMMTISLDVTPTLSEDSSKLAVRVANVEDNRFDQMVTVEQDGQTVGSYKGLKPGEKLDELDVSGAKPGTATVTVSAMEDGEPSGSPSSFEVTIVQSGE